MLLNNQDWEKWVRLYVFSKRWLNVLTKSKMEKMGISTSMNANIFQGSRQRAYLLHNNIAWKNCHRSPHQVCRLYTREAVPPTWSIDSMLHNRRATYKKVHMYSQLLNTRLAFLIINTNLVLSHSYTTTCNQ
jgi:hypothetical protein